MSGSGAHVHRRVAETAQAMAHEVYEELMRRNDWYAIWRGDHPGASSKGLEELWVRQYWGKFIPAARATMASMLALPYDAVLKEQLYSALVLDNVLVRGRKSPAMVLNSGSDPR